MTLEVVGIAVVATGATAEVVATTGADVRAVGARTVEMMEIAPPGPTEATTVFELPLHQLLRLPHPSPPAPVRKRAKSMFSRNRQENSLAVDTGCPLRHYARRESTQHRQNRDRSTHFSLRTRNRRCFSRDRLRKKKVALSKLSILLETAAYRGDDFGTDYKIYRILATEFLSLRRRLSRGKRETFSRV